MDPAASVSSIGLGMAALLGVLQGIAEFLPISSSGHLALAQTWLGIDPVAGGHRFGLVVHGGTLLAVLWVYRSDLFSIISGFFKADPASRSMVWALGLATAPLGIVLIPGVEEAVVRSEGNVRFVGAALLCTAAILGFTHRRQAPLDAPLGAPPLPVALLIGLAQLVAVLPGISRSGSTMGAALALGLGRARAARFSFLLSIPAVTGASGKELLDIASEPASAASVPLVPMLVGFGVSLVVGILSLRLLIGLMTKMGLLIFVPYLILLGGAAVIFG